MLRALSLQVLRLAEAERVVLATCIKNAQPREPEGVSSAELFLHGRVQWHENLSPSLTPTSALGDGIAKATEAVRGMMVAGRHGNKELVDYLLNCGASVEHRSKNGMTALSQAERLLPIWSERGRGPLAVVSNKQGMVLREEAERLGWDRYFHRLIGANDAPEDKPSVLPLRMALEGSGIGLGPEVWFVG